VSRRIFIGLVCSFLGSGIARAAETEGSAAEATPQATIDVREARVQDLERQLADAKALIEPPTVKSAQPPTDLPARFKQAELQTALRLAFKQVNSLAELTDLDCGEYPCIGIGAGIESTQLLALKGTAAMQAYRNDEVSLFVWENRVAVIVAPKGDPALGGDGEQQILTRFRKMASTQPAKGGQVGSPPAAQAARF
jgi:hypothetical protein